MRQSRQMIEKKLIKKIVDALSSKEIGIDIDLKDFSNEIGIKQSELEIHIKRLINQSSLEGKIGKKRRSRVLTYYGIEKSAEQKRLYFSRATSEASIRRKIESYLNKYPPNTSIVFSDMTTSLQITPETLIKGLKQITESGTIVGELIYIHKQPSEFRLLEKNVNFNFLQFDDQQPMAKLWEVILKCSNNNEISRSELVSRYGELYRKENPTVSMVDNIIDELVKKEWVNLVRNKLNQVIFKIGSPNPEILRIVYLILKKEFEIAKSELEAEFSVEELESVLSFMEKTQMISIEQKDSYDWVKIRN